MHGISFLFQSGPESLQGTSSSTAARPLSEEEHLLKKPKLELSPSIQTHHDDACADQGGVDNNNGSPTGSAFRPWNAEEEAAGGGAGGSGSRNVFNGEVAERKLDPYLIRGNDGSKFVFDWLRSERIWQLAPCEIHVEFISASVVRLS